MAHELDPMSMGLLAAGMTMMDPNGGLMQGVRAGFEGYQNAVASNQHRRQLADQQAVRQAFADFAQPDANGNVNTGDIFKKMLASGNPAQVMFALANAPKRTVKSTLKVLDENGVPRHQVLFSDGTEGAMINAPAAERMAFEDMGGVKAGLNPFTGEVLRQFQKSPTPDAQASLAQSAQQFGARMAMDQNQFNQRMAFDRSKAALDYDPSFLAEKAFASEQAKKSAQNLVQGKADLPGVIDKGQNMLNVIKNVVSHPGFKYGVGNPLTTPITDLIVSKIPGTDAAGFKANMDQLLGGQFLQGIEQMRGFGALTETEGTKAANAVARMKTANTKEDFIKSANELSDTIQRGMNLARQKAGQQPVEFSPSSFTLPQKAAPTSGKKSAITPNMFSVEER
jgi:hypothetical protein